MQKWNFSSGWRWPLLLLVVMVGLGFATHQYVVVGHGNIVINLDKKSGNQFVNEEEIRGVLMAVATENAEGASSREVDLRMLEDELLAFSFVKEAQASRDIKGNLIIDIHQDEPVARLLASSGKGAYISRERNLLPLSNKFTSRVMAITGDGADSLLSETFLRSSKGRRICDLIDYINQDPFLAKQIAQVQVNRWMGITLYPQIGRQEIEFGKATDFEKKFNKLDIYYKQIVPKRGWNAYRVVKLQYEDQIVCKR